jgi:hypothetical protein
MIVAMTMTKSKRKDIDELFIFALIFTHDNNFLFSNNKHDMKNNL